MITKIDADVPYTLNTSKGKLTVTCPEGLSLILVPNDGIDRIAFSRGELSFLLETTLNQFAISNEVKAVVISQQIERAFKDKGEVVTP